MMKIFETHWDRCGKCGSREGFSSDKLRGMLQFTLIELLVVVAIISILMAILLPALSSAKNYAWRISCLSALKQLDICFMNYSDENKGTMMPYCSGSSTYTSNWAYVDSFMSSYIPGKLLKKGCASFVASSGLPSFRSCYGYNYFQLYNQTSSISYPLSSVGNPSNTVNFMDSHLLDWTGIGYFDSTYMLGTYMPLGHESFLNCSFVDGHASAMPRTPLSKASGSSDKPSYYFARDKSTVPAGY